MKPDLRISIKDLWRSKTLKIVVSDAVFDAAVLRADEWGALAAGRAAGFFDAAGGPPDQLIALANTIKTAMTGNANFTTPNF